MAKRIAEVKKIKISEKRFKPVRKLLERMGHDRVQLMKERTILEVKQNLIPEGVVRDRHTFSSRNVYESFPHTLLWQFKAEKVAGTSLFKERDEISNEIDMTELEKLEETMGSSEAYDMFMERTEGNDKVSYLSEKDDDEGRAEHGRL